MQEQSTPFPFVEFDQLLAHPKASKREDLERILRSPRSEDWVTWNVLRAIQYFALYVGWTFDFIPVVWLLRRVPRSAPPRRVFMQQRRGAARGPPEHRRRGGLATRAMSGRPASTQTSLGRFVAPYANGLLRLSNLTSSTRKTYLQHPEHFVRWLACDFTPGERAGRRATTACGACSLDVKPTPVRW